MTIFAETERLVLRSLEQDELPRLVELIGAWDVVRWLSVVPFPYTLRDAEEFYEDMSEKYQQSEPQFYTMALKTDNLLIGGVGLHKPRNVIAVPGEIEIGYWLGKDFWGQGVMSEAVSTIMDIGFARPTIQSIGANTDPQNFASQNILRKIGMRNLGIVPLDYAALRGPDQIIKWRVTREEWHQRARP